MEIRKLSIRIPGEWEDGWLYREQLMLWATDGDLISVPLSSVRREIELEFGSHLRVLAEHLVLRSERKSSSEIKDILRVPGVSSNFFAPLSSQRESILSLATLPMSVADVESTPGHITDVSVYGNRILVASDEGLYESQFDPRFPETYSPLHQVTGAPATSVVTYGGQLAVSLGEEGLLAREISFGDGPHWLETAVQQERTQLAEYSRRISRSSVHLLNYGASMFPEFIKASTYRARRSNGFEDLIVSEFARPVSLESQIAEALDSSLTAAEFIENRDFEVLGNANYRLLVQVGDRLSALNILVPRTGPERVTRNGQFRFEPAISSRIPHALTTQALRSGFLVEHLAGVHVLTEDGVIELADETAVQTRTFPNSRRYVDTAIVVRENYVDLVGFVDLDDIA